MAHAFESITSAQNPKIKLTLKLRDKHHRDREKLFVVDSLRDLERALACGYDVHFLLYCDSLASADEQQFVRAQQAQVYSVPASLLEKAAYRQNPGGVIAVVRQKTTLNAANLPEQAGSRLLVLVDLKKPGNIGALLRTADAAGFNAVLLVDTALDLYNPNVIRSSTGACFLGNIYHVTSEQALDYLRAAGYSIVGAHPAGGGSLFETRFDPKCALVLGTEDDGLSRWWQQRCDRLVQIPMTGQLADSLNVSVSGAVFMYEMLRQHTRP